MPQSMFYNPGSQEAARLSFEDQNSETQSRFFESGNAAAQTGNNALFEGYKDNNLVEKELASSSNKEVEDIQREYLAQSEVQRSRAGDIGGVQENGADPMQSYDNLADFNKPGAVQQNPFEMPAGYPDQDGYKKSIVAKQNLPLNEPHPGMNHCEGAFKISFF